MTIKYTLLMFITKRRNTTFLLKIKIIYVESSKTQGPSSCEIISQLCRIQCSCITINTKYIMWYEHVIELEKELSLPNTLHKYYITYYYY